MCVLVAGGKWKSQRDISSFPLTYWYNDIILFNCGVDKNPPLTAFTLSIYIVILWMVSPPLFLVVDFIPTFTMDGFSPPIF
ncbi:hypothetical protein ACE6H2_028512 [Prunus campanulata]